MNFKPQRINKTLTLTNTHFIHFYHNGNLTVLMFNWLRVQNMLNSHENRIYYINLKIKLIYLAYFLWLFVCFIVVLRFSGLRQKIQNFSTNSNYEFREKQRDWRREKNQIKVVELKFHLCSILTLPLARIVSKLVSVYYLQLYGCNALKFGNETKTKLFFRTNFTQTLNVNLNWAESKVYTKYLAYFVYTLCK